MSEWISDLDTAKELLLSSLSHRYEGSIIDLVNVMINEGIEKKIIPGTPNDNDNYCLYRSAFDKETWRLIDTAVWFLYQQGIIIPGIKGFQDGFGTYRISELGKKYFETGQIDVLSGNRYLHSLIEETSGMDAIALKYIKEGLNTYSSQSYLATAVMVGCAAERVVLLLLESLQQYFSEYNSVEHGKLLQELKKNRGIAANRETINLFLNPLLKTIVPNLPAKRVLKYFDLTFSLISETRNKVGHPLGIDISASEASMLLWQLKSILPTIHEIFLGLECESFWQGEGLDAV